MHIIYSSKYVIRTFFLKHRLSTKETQTVPLVHLSLLGKTVIRPLIKPQSYYLLKDALLIWHTFSLLFKAF